MQKAHIKNECNVDFEEILRPIKKGTWRIELMEKFRAQKNMKKYPDVIALVKKIILRYCIVRESAKKEIQ